MKGILIFNLPKEQENFKAAQNGMLYKTLIDDLYENVFRPHIKYGRPILGESESKMQELTEEQYLVIDVIWEKVNKHFQDSE